jgi:hypothetical protein
MHVFLATAITPGKCDINKLKSTILETLRFQGKKAAAYLGMTTEYWVHKPTFVPVITKVSTNPSVLVGPVLDTNGKKWLMVNGGTRYRRVIFNSKYEPKTQFPGSLGTNTPGKFTKDLRPFKTQKDREDSKIVALSQTPLPGIRPRGWIEIIEHEMQPGFTDAVNYAIQKGGAPLVDP